MGKVDECTKDDLDAQTRTPDAAQMSGMQASPTSSPTVHAGQILWASRQEMAARGHHFADTRSLGTTAGFAFLAG